MIYCHEQRKKETRLREKVILGMLMIFVSVAAYAQVNITGIATDAATREPLPFITIQIKGSAQGTTTDIDGRYILSVPNRNTVLIFSYIGYKTVEVTVGNQTQINVALQEDTELLDEVVVV